MLDLLRDVWARLTALASELGGLLETLVARLTHTWALWLLAVMPVLWVFGIVAFYRRRRALRRLGSGLALRALTSVHGRWRGLRNLCWSTAVMALVLGIAGPRWGTDPAQQAASGRDLVVVLDLSRSMLAEQPSRQKRAHRALFELADSLQRRGGHRVALVIFAAQARLVCPLTHDYDHFRDAVEHADADHLPLDLRPVADGPPSGTRIGAALRLALTAHDPQLEGYQDVLLVSDGDDPGGDDEWAEGAEQARLRGIPVYCLGVGDPAAFSEIPTPQGPLTHDGQVIKTRLEERPLQEIARRSGGVYLPGRTRPLPRAALYREVLEGRARHASRDVALPMYHPRYPWFFATALALFAAALLLGGRAATVRPLAPPPKRKKDSPP
jgi:Ca-activated chloride channel family protein